MGEWMNEWMNERMNEWITCAAKGWLEFAGVENDGLEIDGVEREQTYISLLHPKNFNVYDM